MAQNAPPDFVQVPPGHEVRVFYPSPTAHVSKSEAGVWIADLGPSPAERLGPESRREDSVFDELGQILGKGQTESVVWILQESYLHQLPNLQDLLARFEALVHASGDRVAHCAVFPMKVTARFGFMQDLKNLGMSVHFSAPDYACFVEVKRPSDLVVGMPGRSFLGSDARLSRLMSEIQNEDSTDTYQRFVQEFAESQVGVIAEHGGLGETSDPQGRSLILAFADPEAFCMKFGEKFNAEMAGVDVLQTVEYNPECDGIRVNSAEAEISLIIDRAAAISLLRHREQTVV